MNYVKKEKKNQIFRKQIVFLLNLSDVIFFFFSFHRLMHDEKYILNRRRILFPRGFVPKRIRTECGEPSKTVEYIFIVRRFIFLSHFDP